MNRGEIYYIAKREDAYKPSSQFHSNVIEPGRPAIIVSNSSLNNSNNTVTVVYLTSKPKLENPAYFTVVCKGNTSTVLCDQIITIDKSRVGSYITTLNAKEMESLNAALAYTLELNTGTAAGPEEQQIQNEIVEKYAQLVSENKSLIEQLNAYRLVLKTIGKDV